MPSDTYDVVVIGGGMAGVSAAYELAADARVLVVEAEGDLPIHTTGRSAAMLLPAYGNPLVRGLTRASQPDFDLLTDALESPRLLTARLVLYVATSDAEDHLASLLSDHDLKVLTSAEACGLFPALNATALSGAAVDDTGSDIDVMALHQGYLRGFRARGGDLIRNARVNALRRSSHGWTVGTTQGLYAAERVVNAAGAWADEIAELAGQSPVGLQALRRTAFIAPVDAPPVFQSWPFLMDAGERYYAKPEGDALLGSPADETPHEPGDPRADELGVAMALEYLRAVTTFPLRTVRTQWAGLRTFSPDRSPVVGESAAGTGFWWFAGQGGYGIQFAPALARSLASLMGDAQLPADLLAEGVTASALSPRRYCPDPDLTDVSP